MGRGIEAGRVDGGGDFGGRRWKVACWNQVAVGLQHMGHDIGQEGALRATAVVAQESIERIDRDLVEGISAVWGLRIA